jgi:histidinol phosphatase-like enzyme (inositol monophosphatase family)
MHEGGLQARFDHLTRWLDELRPVSLHWAAQRLKVESKSDGSPVTQADRAIESALRAKIRMHHPQDAILGEEHGDEPGTSGWRWIIDPIDGTASFIRGLPLWGTLIGLERRCQGGDPIVVAGVADYPALGERIEAPSPDAAWWTRADHRQRCHVAPPRSLRDATICTTGTEYFRTTNCLELWSRLGEASGSVRGWSDCTALLLLATGRVDAVVEPVMHPWDVGPFAAILPAAGATWSAFDGRTHHLAGSVVAATTPTLHGAILAALHPPQN